MTATAPHPHVTLPPRKAFRDTSDIIIGGVASGLARHLGVPVTWVRAAFVVGTLLGFFGVFLYAGLWLVLPSDSRFETAAPGLESATRGGRRPGRIRRLQDLGPAIALAALGFGAVLILQGVLGDVVVWPLFLAVLGLALLWRQADEAQRERWRDTTGRLSLTQLVVGGGWGAWARIGAGMLLVVVAGLLLAIDSDPGGLGAGWGPVLAVLFALAAIGVVIGPWLHRLATDLSAEREERIRSQERADMAAHLHDSVLQTLALIQKNSGDPTTVARLARSQERDLRSWLYAEEAADQSTLASSLRAAAAEVEDAHGVSVDVVTVGDCDLVEELRPIVAAAREAMTNAAKHAGTGRVDVYAEVTAAAADVFVRDRGEGFDPDRIADGRHGVKHSIVGRMARHGGSAEIRSAVGEGTEVRLHLPRPTDRPAERPTEGKEEPEA